MKRWIDQYLMQRSNRAQFRPSRHTARLNLGRLEDRTVPTNISWTGGPTGNGTLWSDPTNWNPQQVPGNNDDALIPSTGSNPSIIITNGTVLSVNGTTRKVVVTGTCAIGLGLSTLSEMSNSGSLILTSGKYNFANTMNTGTLEVSGGATIYGTVTNDGTLVATGLAALGTLTTTAGSTIRVTHGALINPLTIVNGFTNNGLIEFNGPADSSNAAISIPNGTLTNGATGSIVGNGLILGSGSITPPPPLAITGTGTVSPGLGGAGRIGIFGKSAIGGPLVVDLNGAMPGTEYDQIRCYGALPAMNLSGPLSVKLNYAANIGDSFLILNNEGQDPISGTFAGLPQGATIVDGGQVLQINYEGGADNNDVVLTVISPNPQVQSVVLNGGSPQRSRVTEVAIAFNQVVNLPANPADAFQILRQSDNALAALSASVVNGANTVVTLTFTGGLSEFGSLADDRYTLTIDASKVSTPLGTLDGNGDGTGGDSYVLASAAAPNPPTNIFRYFGDVDGNGVTDATDFLAFRATTGLPSTETGFNAAFDVDSDGDVDAMDFLAFRSRFGTGI